MVSHKDHFLVVQNRILGVVNGVASHKVTIHSEVLTIHIGNRIVRFSIEVTLDTMGSYDVCVAVRLRGGQRAEHAHEKKACNRPGYQLEVPHHPRKLYGQRMN